MAKSYKVLFLFANDSVRKGLADPDALAALMQEASLEVNPNMEIFVSYARSLSFFISNNKAKIRDHRNHMNLEEYDFVYFRKAGSAMQQMLTCALYLTDHEIPFYDTEIAKSSSRNKLSQMYMLQRRSVPIPKTLFCRNNRRLVRLVATRYAKDFSFPIIAKATGGTRGDANYLVKSVEELEKIVADEKRHFIIQEFIPNDGDMRFFIAGGELYGSIKRKSVEGTHLNNTSKGGSAELLSRSDFSRSLISDALLAARVFGRDCAGVDVIVNKETNAHYILEVNRAPQIEHASFEKEKAVWMVDAITKTIDNYQSAHKEGEPTNVFGRFESVHIMTSKKASSKLIAKVDTGADSSSIHATDITIDDDILSCTIAGERMSFVDFADKKVKSSNGTWQHRYLVAVPARIGNTVYNIKVTLSDRSAMNYDMLIGRRFLRTHELMVNVGRRYIASGKKQEATK